MKKTFKEVKNQASGIEDHLIEEDKKLINELGSGGDMCDIDLDKLRSKSMRDVWKKQCEKPARKKEKDSGIRRAAKRAGIGRTQRDRLYNDTQTEGWFDKKSPEDQKIEDLEDDLRKLSSKAAGRGGWSKREQEKYNEIWMELHKMGRTPTYSPPSVYGDDSWATKTKKLHKKLGLRRRDHEGVIEGYQQTSNLVDISQEVMNKIIKALKKEDFRTVQKLYKELGNIIK